jgi:hypothetical protein
MASQRRIESSRANGAKSKGRAAGLSHRPSPVSVVLAHENQDEFRALRDAYLTRFQPQTAFERALVDQLVNVRWRLNRASSVEAALLEVEVVRSRSEIAGEFECCGPENRIALPYRRLAADSRALANLERYEARLIRFHRLLDALFRRTAHVKGTLA